MLIEIFTLLSSQELRKPRKLLAEQCVEIPALGIPTVAESVVPGGLDVPEISVIKIFGFPSRRAKGVLFSSVSSGRASPAPRRVVRVISRMVDGRELLGRKG